MEILARAVGRRKEAVAQVQMVRGTGKFIINEKQGNEYLQNDSCAILSVQAPFEIYKKSSTKAENSTESLNSGNTISGPTAPYNNSLILEKIDTIIKVKGGGLKGQADAIRLGIARALCVLASNTTSVTTGPNPELVKATKAIVDTTAGMVVGLKKQLKDKGYLTQDSRVKERRKYGLKKARKASQYHKR